VSSALTLAGPEHLKVLLPLVAAFHKEEGITSTPEDRQAALQPLLEGIPHGAAYLIGPARSPIGYIVISFGWSVEFGGLDGLIDELYIRRAVRGRGIASSVLSNLPRALAGAGLKALHLEVATDNGAAANLYRKNGFEVRGGFHLMSRKLSR